MNPIPWSFFLIRRLCVFWGQRLAYLDH
jgi:hypothetical protein